MTKRLVKIAKELNVGTTTIVDYLNNHGFDIENKPTAKITNEMYDELLKEFQKSIAIKEEASKLIIGNRTGGKGDTEEPVHQENGNGHSNNNAGKEAGNSNAKEKAPELKSDQTSQKIPETTPEKAEGKEERVDEQPKLKVLGKIDLGSRLRSKAEKKQKDKDKAKKAPKENTPEQKEKPAAQEDKKADSAQENAPKQKVEEPKPVVENKQADGKKEKEDSSKNKIADQKGKKEQQKNTEEKSTSKDPKAGFDEEKGTVKSTAGKDEGNPDSMVRIEAPELRGLKIQGKIDIDKFKRSSKKRGSKDGNKKEDKTQSGSDNKGSDNRRRDRKDRDRPKSGDDKRGDRQDNKPTDRKERPDRKGRPRNENRSENRGDRNRRPDEAGRSRNTSGGAGPRNDDRAGRPKSDEGQKDTNNKSTEGQGGEETGRRRRRTRRKVTVDNNSNSNSNSRDNKGRSQRRKDHPKKDEIKEVSQKEIEEKLKATMERLSGRGKKKRQRLQRDKRERMREKKEAEDQAATSEKLQVTEFISVSELASLLEVDVTEVITACMNLGVIVSINQRLDAEIIELVAAEFDREIEFISAEEEEDDELEVEDDPEDLLPRAPIVTVMGHVDHGKTSLLDYIRKASVVSGEAGGITQHIGAYEVAVGEDKRKITFLDTPGHEAFTAMRARGAKVTDIAIIVIAADDSIMPQTKEAISHAQAADVPIIFAINKIDKPDSAPERIKQELANMNLLVEEWGGKYQSQDISAKTGLNIDQLLEKVLLEAELLELGANPDRPALGTVIEASLERGRGYVTKMLVQTGTLKIGDSVVAGEVSGKVRAMLNERGQRVKEAGPSTPIMILGLDGAPQAGERFKHVDSDQEARQIASRRAQIAREQANRATKRISLDEIGRRLALGNFKELNLIVKGDVDGSVEALSDALIKQSIESIQVNVIHKAVGQIIESDILLASASDAIIIGFQVRPSANARKLAEREGVEIKMYSIIYEAIEQVKLAIEGMLEPDKEEQIRSQVEVREIYKISKVGTVAGCYVQEGKINRNHHIRLIRDGIVVYPTKEGAHAELGSLKRFKEDAKEVSAGFECGLTIKNYNDLKEGDIVESYEIVEVKRKL